MFVLLGVIISIGALLEISRGKTYKRLFALLFFILTAMLCLRYGQGTDYKPYELQYVGVSPDGGLFTNTLFHGELGWYMLMLLFRRMGSGYPLFLGIVSAIMMAFTYRGIKCHSPLNNFSLLLLYPTFYLTYYYSAIRQGLALSIFLGFGIELLKQQKYWKFYIVVIVMSLFHSASIVLFILPVLLRLKDSKPSKWLIAAFAFTIIIGYTGLLNEMATAAGINSYFKASISLLAIVLRLLYGFIIYRFHSIIDRYGGNESEKILYLLYMWGLVIFAAFSFAATLSQRLTMCLKAIEVILLPLQISILHEFKEKGIHFSGITLKTSRGSLPVAVIIIVASLNIELIKNLYSYIEQGNYYDWVNPINYPYVSVFNEERIFDYLSNFKL